MADFIAVIAFIIFLAAATALIAAIIWYIFIKRNLIAFALVACIDAMVALTAHVVSGGFYIAADITLGFGKIEWGKSEKELSIGFSLFSIGVFVLIIVCLSYYAKDRWYKKGYIS